MTVVDFPLEMDTWGGGVDGGGCRMKKAENQGSGWLLPTRGWVEGISVSFECLGVSPVE